MFDPTEFDVTVGTLAPPGPLHQDMVERGVRTLSLNCRGRVDFPRAVIQLAQHLRAHRIDVIHTHLFEGCLVGLLAARLAGTPLAVFAGHHSHELPLRPRRLAFWLDVLGSRWLSHGIVAPSQQMKDILVAEEKVSPSRVEVLPYPIDFRRLQPSTDGRQRVRKELGLNGKVVIGGMGRFYWVKNYGTLMRVFAELVPDFPDTLLLLVGGGPEADHLQNLAQELNIAHRVVLTNHRPDIADVFSAMDVFVHPSLAESFGLVIVEALALKKPVITTEVGIANQVIDSGVNGYIVPPGDEHALRDTLRRTLSDPKRWQAMGELGPEHIGQFEARHMVARYEQYYKRELRSPLLSSKVEHQSARHALRLPDGASEHDRSAEREDRQSLRR